MKIIIENWFVFVGVAAVVVVAVAAVLRFLHTPRQAQLEQVREWLLWAVVQAERNLGSNTGALKLRWVYDKFITRFPRLSRLISFDEFSAMVNDALVQLQPLLESNQTIRRLVVANAEIDG